MSLAVLSINAKDWEKTGFTGEWMYQLDSIQWKTTQQTSDILNNLDESQKQ